jgi:hypothetical protein
MIFLYPTLTADAGDSGTLTEGSFIKILLLKVFY